MNIVSRKVLHTLVAGAIVWLTVPVHGQEPTGHPTARATIDAHFANRTTSSQSPSITRAVTPAAALTAEANAASLDYEPREASNEDLLLLAAIITLVRFYDAGVIGGLIPVPQIGIPAEAVQIVTDNALKFLPPRLIAPGNLRVDSAGADGPVGSDGNPVFTADGCGVEFELLAPQANYSNLLGVLNFRDPYTRRNPFALLPWKRFNDPGAVDTRWGYLRAPRLYHGNTDVRLWITTPEAVQRYDQATGTFGEPYYPIDSFAERPQQVYLPIGEHAIEWNATSEMSLLLDVAFPVSLFSLTLLSELKSASGSVEVAKNVKKSGIGEEAAEQALDPAGAKRLSDGIKRFNDIWTEQFAARQARRKPDTKLQRLGNTARKIKEKIQAQLAQKVRNKVAEKLATILLKLSKAGLNSIDGGTRDDIKALLPQFPGYVGQWLAEIMPDLSDAIWGICRDRYPAQSANGCGIDFVIDVLPDITLPVLGELLRIKGPDFPDFIGKLVTIPTAATAKGQAVTVLDSVPPTINLGAKPIVKEATDFGGTRLYRLRAELLATAAAASSDNCGRDPIISLSAPLLLPLGETDVIFTATDRGPNPNDGQDYAPTVTQTVLIQDTQAPLMLAPPSKVVMSNAAVPFSDELLGDAVAIDLVDVQPIVSKLAPPIFPLNSRTSVIWSAIDGSGNVTEPQIQLISIKSDNEAPEAFATTAVAETAQPVNIELFANDPDVLDGIADPLQFRIESQPRNGKFIAPLYPFFVEDYRTQPGDGLGPDFDPTDPANFDPKNFIDSNYCFAEPKQVPPRNFAHDVKFVHVTDDGIRYMLDEYYECLQFNQGAQTHARFSKWDSDNKLLGQVRIGSGPTDEPLGGTFRVDRDGFLYYNGLQDPGGSEEFWLVKCSVEDWQPDGNRTTSDVCVDAYKFDGSSGPDGTLADRLNYARIDSERQVAYVVDDFGLFALQLLSTGGTRYLGELGPRDELGEVLDGWFGEIPSLEVGSDGAVYGNDLTRHRIHKIAPVTVNADGELVLGEYLGWSGQCSASTTNACNVELQRSRGYFCTDATCTVTGTGAGALQGQFNNPKYVALDPNDILYVADYNNSRIQRLSPDGSFAGEAVSEGTGINKGERPSFVIGNFGMPESVAVNSSQFFIVDRAEQFVNVFGTLPFKNVTDNSAWVTYVSNLSFPSPLTVDDDFFSFSVTDGLDTSPHAEVTITVSRTFRAPEALEETITVAEDGSVDFTLPARDLDGIIGKDVLALDTLTYQLTRWPEHGRLSGFGESWTYTPEADYFGTDTLAFMVNDGLDDSNEATLTFDVTAVNDAPVVAIEPPERIGLGFPTFVSAVFTDDALGAIGEDYLAGIEWGDGQVDITGEVVSDDDESDPRIDGIIIVPPADPDEEGRAMALHTYEAPGAFEIIACLQDKELAEGCGPLTVTVESLVSIDIGSSFYDTPLAEDEVTLEEYPDGQLFTFEMKVLNGEPSVGAGEVADNVVVDLQVPANTTAGPIVPGKGSCTREDDLISCAIGAMLPGEEVLLLLPARGPGNLIYNEDREFNVTLTTTSDAVAPEVGLASFIELIADTTDSDGDGMSDTFEDTYGFDPGIVDGADDADADGLTNAEEFELGSSPLLADTDGDGLTDLLEQQNGLNPRVDDNPPELTIPTDITVNATGALTAIDLGAASAQDFKDGSLNIVATNGGPFQPGRNTVIWRAFDAAGNKAEGFQFVNVVPLVNFIVDQVVAEGATALARVELNGAAVDYPVVVPFTVSGSAVNPADHDAVTGEIVIESGLVGMRAVTIAADIFDEPDETVVLSMGTPVNAVTGAAGTHTITISEQNQAPLVQIAVEQQGRPSTTIVNGAGLIAVLADLRDDPAQDHSFDWSGSAAGLFETVSVNDPSYLLDPSGLSQGLYDQRVAVVDNGVPPLGVTTTSLLRVDDVQLILRSDEDSDGDGSNDLAEGPDDNDGDRLPDYLDNIVSSNLLQIGEEGYRLETATGWLLRLGKTAFSQGSVWAGLPESDFAIDPAYGFASGVLDFEIVRLTQGATVRVVVPLAHPAVSGSVYKRFVNGGWQAFSVTGADLIESATATVGACPPTGSTAYQPGLLAGASCLQLSITDGGPNDDDGVVDAVVRTTGGLATPISAQITPVTSRRVTLTGDGEVVVARYRIHSDSGDLEVRSLTIETSGSGDETEIDKISLIVDQNRDGVFNDGDTEVADDQLTIDNGSLTLNLLEPYTVQPGDTDLLVVYRFGPPID